HECCHGHGEGHHHHDHKGECCHGHGEGHHHHHEHGSHSHHVHRGMKEIEKIVKSLNLSDKVKEDILAVYKLIAQAESKSHNIDVSEIHFHEVGALDAIADIAAVCYLIDKLDIDKIIVSILKIGSGHGKCAYVIYSHTYTDTSYIL